MQLGRTYIYSNFLKAIMIFATMLLTMGVSLMLTPRTDMSEVTKYTVVGIVWLVALYVVSRRFRTIAEGNAPRPWWRMTAARFLGWAFAIFFAAMGIWIAVGTASQQSAARDCVSRIRRPVCCERAAAADAPAVRGGKVAGLGH